jgi:DNA polymerase/3'-5' exonuclease PolX
MTDYREKIIEELEVMSKNAKQESNVFRARAYDKVLKQLKTMTKPVNTIADLSGIDGIGKGIREKIIEIINTGTLLAAEAIKNDTSTNVLTALMKIHGVGPVKARNLVQKSDIKSVEDLKEKVATNSKLLNAQQKIGLKHYDDFLLRIPREEMHKHEIKILSFIKNAQIVGSYRRGAKDSGDIDVLMKADNENSIKEFKAAIEEMKGEKYITDILALGDHKCMAVVKIGKQTKYRRLDILLTPASEYATSVLYFTGSDKFNIQMRKKALAKGYSLSEHGLKKKDETLPDAPVFHTEKDIFDFLDMEYVEPNKRV